MPANYILLEKIVVGAAGAATVTFSNIPQTGYTDLVLKTSARNSGGNVGNYSAFTIAGAYTPSGLFFRGNGSAASTGTSQYGQMETGGGAVASSFSNTETYFPNYTSASYKSLSTDSIVGNNVTEGYNNLSAGVVSNTSAITSLTIAAATGTFVQHSTFYLYGVAKLNETPAISPKATGGDTIMTDGTYWYHTFLSSGTFTPNAALSCDYLVVAGGGGGSAGGGGAGGLRSTVTATGGGGSLESALSLASGTGYTVTIGAGGAGGAADANTGVNGTNGSNSVFSTITSTGGGGGAKDGTANGNNGGSGGGLGWNNVGQVVGTGTANQGFNGGSFIASGSFAAGGGGGAGAVGQTAPNNNTGGAGGAGVAITITGSSVTYAGGGGAACAITPGVGGAGGAGGGGTGGNGGTGGTGGTAGTANTGGGGGGRTNQGTPTAYAGGSGIVIVRYAV
jgi:hypothetical protein